MACQPPHHPASLGAIGLGADSGNPRKVGGVGDVDDRHVGIVLPIVFLKQVIQSKGLGGLPIEGLVG